MTEKSSYHLSRRGFIKLGTLVSLPLYLGGLSACSGRKHKKHRNFELIIQSNYPGGHQIMEALAWPVAKKLNTKTLIAGGGLAGLSAAAGLKDKDYLLFELGSNFGGTSSASVESGMPFTQGAHYDLAYPEYFGNEVLKLLSDIGVLKFNTLNRTWEYTDKRFLIPDEWENNVVAGKTERPTVLPDIPQTQAFDELMKPYVGKMLMPVRNMDKDLMHLDDLTFTAYLEKELGTLDLRLKQALNHQMLDDFGGNTDTVSALAGIHYYTCRPYKGVGPELFSPPQGNYYFVEKILEQLNWTQLYTNHLVAKVQKTDRGYETTVLDLANKQKLQVSSERIIYAGKKHALKYIYPQAAAYYGDLVYAPWVTLNFILDNLYEKQGVWQNEWLGKARGYMGFVDSDAQFYEENPKRIFTAYYCLPPEDRINLQSNEFLGNLAHETLDIINEYFGEHLDTLVEKVYVKPMGHAMACPKPGFLTKPRFEQKTFKPAGVDNGRLPLLFEAIDSGLSAAHKLNKL